MAVSTRRARKKLGGSYHTHAQVIETNQRADGSWDVVTKEGTIHAEHIVNAGGLWAREVGHLSGLNLPVQPMEHHYLITETIPEIAAREERLPAGIDYEGNIYFRQEGQGMLLGTYEPKATPWMVGGTPNNFGHELLEPQLDHIAERLELGFERIPALAEAGIKDMVNGPFTFGPDGNPMIGPVPGMRNYWAAVGVMAGFCQAGGVGKCLAEWMIDGEPEVDVWAMDIARFGDYASPDYGTIKSSENYERRFVMTFPNETLPKGRRMRTTALYDRLTAKGAVWGDGFGLESALWFADGPEDAHEEPTFRRSRAHDYVAREVKAVREAVGITEIANFAKHSITGPDARKFLDTIMAGRVPQPGRITLSPMLTAKGKLYGDLTIACYADDDIGKEAAMAERQAGPTIKLVTMTIDTDDIDVSNDEAILKDGECVGYVTSGGYAHHVQQSMALGYVPAELAADGTEPEDAQQPDSPLRIEGLPPVIRVLAKRAGAFVNAFRFRRASSPMPVRG
ncbi:MAG: FAD-dependent oxidoreductase [Gammaproteobacteria bacterium]|nr:FAD-dependent oxidoreductase [Gammaproteobacteria bacterium]